MTAADPTPTAVEGSQTLGNIAEVFLSFQGEGLHVGEAHVFLRLGGCSLRCRYCDTPDALVQTSHCRVHLTEFEFSGKHTERPRETEERIQNPIGAEDVSALIDRVDPHFVARTIAITGGEPLDQAPYLLETLIQLDGRRTIYLETAGVHVEALKSVLPWVDIVAMDIKLPSVAGEGDRFREHEAFLREAIATRVIVKVIISERLDLEDLRQAASLVARVDPDIPFVLQPETDRTNGRPFSGPRLMDAYRMASHFCRDVRLIPQTHKFIGVA